jgi:hypothetical protein
MTLTQVRPAYMARVKMRRVREPFWFIAQYDERVNQWIAYCPTAWLSKEQRYKLHAEKGEYVMATIDPNDRHVKIFYDKPVQCRREHRVEKVTLDGSERILEERRIDYGYRWEFDVDWLP